MTQETHNQAAPEAQLAGAYEPEDALVLRERSSTINMFALFSALLGFAILFVSFISKYERWLLAVAACAGFLILAMFLALVAQFVRLRASITWLGRQQPGAPDAAPRQPGCPPTAER